MRPRRSLGQNFLADRRAARRLVDAFAPAPGEAVVEIGPGRGALTSLLAERASPFVAVEVDPRLIPALEALLAGHRGARVLHADALDVDWSSLAAEIGRGPLAIIGNLPYNAGTAIVRRLLASRALARAQFVLQLEVVERIVAPAGRRAYGPLSVLAALRGGARKLFTLPPGAFRPRPRVRSAAIAFDWRAPAAIEPHEVAHLEGWLFRGFRHRRKTLAGNLAPWRDVVVGQLERAGLPRDARAEALPPALWLDLARALGPPPADGEESR